MEGIEGRTSSVHTEDSITRVRSGGCKMSSGDSASAERSDPAAADWRWADGAAHGSVRRRLRRGALMAASTALLVALIGVVLTVSSPPIAPAHCKSSLLLISALGLMTRVPADNAEQQ